MRREGRKSFLRRYFRPGRQGRPSVLEVYCCREAGRSAAVAAGWCSRRCNAVRTRAASLRVLSVRGESAARFFPSPFQVLLHLFELVFQLTFLSVAHSSFSFQ